MSNSRLPIEGILKSAGSLTSAFLLLGFQYANRGLHLGSKGLQPGGKRSAFAGGAVLVDRIAPRTLAREVIGAAWHCADVLQEVTSGSDGLFLREFQNKLECFSLFEHVDHAVGVGRISSLSLSQLVARTNKLDPYISVWAREGVGHYFADRVLAESGEPRALMTRTDLRGVPEASLVPLNAGLGLALAEWLLRTAEGSIESRVIAKFVEVCRCNCSPGYVEVGFEALGLAARSLHPHLISRIDEILSHSHPELLEYFWHGVGRALYFSPTDILSLCSEPWQGLEISLQEPPHELGRRNAVAGYIWALVLVNIRHPEVVAEFLSRKAAQVLEPQVLANGLCSALAIWSEVLPGERYVREFVTYHDGLSKSSSSRLWSTYVQQPWAGGRGEHFWDQRHIGLLFRHQSQFGAIGLNA